MSNGARQFPETGDFAPFCANRFCADGLFYFHVELFRCAGESPPQRRREQRIKSRWMLKSISCKISPKHRVTACAAHCHPNPSEHIVGIRKRREFLRLRVLKGQPQLKRRIPALWANRRMQGNRCGRLPVIQHIRIAVASAVKKRNVAVWLMKRNAKHVPIRQKLIPPEKPAFQPSTELNSQIFTSGQLPVSPETGETACGGISGQARQSCENVRAVLEAAGSSMEHPPIPKAAGDFSTCRPSSHYFIRSSSSARRAS